MRISALAITAARNADSSSSPCRRPPAHVPRANPFGHNAFEAHPARMTKDSGPRAVSASAVAPNVQAAYFGG
jgi:hypothetical protein